MTRGTPTTKTFALFIGDAESRQQGLYTVAEVVDLIRAETLVYVSDGAFERTALVRVVDANPPTSAHGHMANGETTS
jgi:hypothetical protein